MRALWVLAMCSGCLGSYQADDDTDGMTAAGDMARPATPRHGNPDLAPAPPTIPTLPATHTQSDVCQAYRDSGAVDPTYYTDNAPMCDPDVVSQGGRDDAARRTSFYRWLVGLGPVTAGDATSNSEAQACAVMSAWNPAGPAAHTPSPSANCYTATGAAGAGASNIAWGVHTGPSMVDLLMEDPGNETTLGHRRWILSRGLQAIGVGIYHGGTSYGGAACQKIFGVSGGVAGPQPAIVAFPPPGYVPIDRIIGPWSLSANGFDLAALTVTITRVSDGASLPVVIQPLGGSYGDPTTSWSPSGWGVSAGETYHVVVSDGTSSAAWDLMPVSC